MVQDTYNIFPVTLAVLLHVFVFGSLFVTLDLSRAAAPPMPLAIKATLVSADALPPPPVIQRPQPTPEVIRPAPDEDSLRQAEQEKRLQDARREQDRLERLERARLEARREREAEAERDRKLAEMEEQRLRDIAQQRQDNILEEERLLREANDAMIAAEEEVFAAQDSTEAQVYQNTIIQHVNRHWARPGTARAGLECIVAETDNDDEGDSDWSAGGGIHALDSVVDFTDCDLSSNTGDGDSVVSILRAKVR